jgi:hypothetical protein
MDEKQYIRTMYYVDRKNVSARYMSIGWFEGRFELPEKKITRVSISPVKALSVSSVFDTAVKGDLAKGDMANRFKDDYRNRFKVTVKNGNIEESFDFTVSINDTKQLKPKLALSDNDHIYTLYCFIGDAIAGAESFEDFKGNFGYDDCCEAYRIHKLCKESTLKAVRLGLGDLYKVSDYIQEKYPEVV